MVKGCDSFEGLGVQIRFHVTGLGIKNLNRVTPVNRAQPFVEKTYRNAVRTAKVPHGRIFARAHHCYHRLIVFMKYP